MFYQLDIVYRHSLAHVELVLTVRRQYQSCGLALRRADCASWTSCSPAWSSVSTSLLKAADCHGVGCHSNCCSRIGFEFALVVEICATNDGVAGSGHFGDRFQCRSAHAVPGHASNRHKYWLFLPQCHDKYPMRCVVKTWTPIVKTVSIDLSFSGTCPHRLAPSKTRYPTRHLCRVPAWSAAGRNRCCRHRRNTASCCPRNLVRDEHGARIRHP